MNPRYRMLLWEQARTAGILCAAVGGVAVLLFLHVYLLTANDYLFLRAGQDLAISFLSFALPLACTLIIVRQNARGHLALDFEPRLLYLPIKVTPVVAIVFASRFAYFTIMALFLYGVYAAFFGGFPELRLYVVAGHLFLVVQAFVWSRKSITGLAYLLPMILLLLVGMLLLLGVSSERLSEAASTWGDRFNHPASLLLTAPVAFLLAWAGVTLLRRDERIGLPPAGDLLRWAADFRADRALVFKTPLEAQLWYEQRRVGRLLPLLTLLFTFVCILLFGISRNPFSGYHRVLMMSPLIALLAAAFVVGPVALRPRSRMPFHRPQTVTTLAMVAILNHLRTLFLCFPLVAAMVAAGALLDGYGGVALAQILREGELDLVDMLTMLLRPTLGVFIVGWAILWLTTLPYIVPTAAVLAMVILDGYYLHPARNAGISEFVYVRGVTFPIILLLALVAVLALLLALRRRLFSPTHVFAGLFLWQNITLLLIAASPYVGLHFYSVIACQALAMAMLLPLLAAPLSMYRHKFKG